MARVYQSRYEQSASVWYRATQAVWYLLYIFESLLTLRFALRAIGADASTAFTSIVYNATSPLIAPFDTVVRSLRINNTVLEWSTLLAMVVFWFAAWALIRLFSVADAGSETARSYYDQPKSYDNSVERFEREPLNSSRPDYFDDEATYYSDYSMRKQQPRL